MDLNRAVRQSLTAWQQSGLTHLSQGEDSALLEKLFALNVAESSSDHTEPDKPAPAAATPQSVPPSTPPKTTAANSERPTSSAIRSESTMKKSDRELALTKLAERVATCTRCQELAAKRTQTVFGTGNPSASVMFIGEAPGADEDEQGVPFVGRAGKLLDKIIAACGWKREELYICNILRCRPPGNRNPTPIEAGNCREYLDGQIEIVDPDYIVCWGTIAAQNLLGNKTPIGRMRGELFTHGRAKVLCTYHPSYLLRNPPAKKHVWEDLKILLKEMGINPDELPSQK